ncbi:MAG: addiction module protein [Planctomycetia bacterium]|nr:addiction module protein [Planctomycetia bacterium]
MSTADQILHDALSLPAHDRAAVAHELLLSLEPETADEDVDKAWAAEIRRRLKAIREGRAVLRDWNEALAEIRQAMI